ncbi:hypothetical protein [Pseudoduganella chitinolytica]|uniref:Bacteriocin n=1 Tax=Pseudoduganella chitinolytica TaxID=34070 RepID=A0ABY8B905_9BURK|nr:hypothetical protein [Pseudoduganella chitinolytica]WEF32201.1 hypothetical protein PX653_22715 [Pseudoduganella chitinolytica]
MQIVERILAKVVGKELSAEEVAKVSGGHTGKECPEGTMQTVHSGEKPTGCDKG